VKTKNRIYDFLFYICIGTLYCYALSSGVMAATIVEESQLQLLFFSAMAMTALYLVFYNRYTFLTVLGAFTLTVLVLFLYLRAKDFQVEWFMGLLDSAGELFDFVRDLVPARNWYTQPVSLGVVALVALPSALCLKVHYNFYVLTLLALGVFIVPVLGGYDTSESAILIFLFCFVVLYCKKGNLFASIAQRGKRKANPAFALAIIPVCALFVGVAWFLPKPDLDLTAGGGGSASNSTISTDPVLSLSDRGNRLGGPTTLNGDLVMEVQADDRIYLLGSVRDTYTGSSWEMSARGNVTLSPGDDGVYDISPYSQSMREEQLFLMAYYGWERKEVTVTMGDVRTQTVFTPPFQSDLRLAQEAKVTADSYFCLSVDNAMNNGDSYTQQYIGWDYDSEYFRYLLQEPTDTYDEEETRQYLQLPDSLPERVGALAADLTKDCSNDYDKVKALEQYLKQFPYTLKPDYVPAGEDFVDYFLFTGQEGYCVYYATALAVMGRSLDIPTRYVEGYVLPQQPGDNGLYQVTNAQAHAWVEAFFPRFGWVRFEATAPDFNTHFTEEAEEWPLEDPQEPELPDTQEVEIPEPEESQPEPEDAATEDSDGQTEQKTGSWWWLLWLFLALAAVAGGAVLFVRGVFHAYRTRMEKLSALPNAEAAVTYFHYIANAAGTLGFPMSRQETALCYARRVGGEIQFQRQAATLEELADIFSRAVYSRQEITDEEIGMLKDCYQDMLQQLQGSVGRARFFVNRYVLGRY